MSFWTLHRIRYQGAEMIRQILMQMRIAPLKVSKYCIGTVLTVRGIKANRFKLKLRDIEKRLGGLNITTSTDKKN